jgi:prophage antirepressor-like protein
MADVYDEIEALVLGPPAAEPTIAKQAAPLEVKETKSSPLTPLVALFEAILIRILGTVDDPLFCARDVAAHVGDVAHYARVVNRYTLGEHTQKIEITNSRGELRPAVFLTEAGVYKYLLQAKGEKAEEFQRFVYKLLKEERKKTVDSIQLALKIEQTKNEELKREKSSLQRSEARLYQAANDAKGKVAEQAREIAKLRKAKSAAEDAAYLRSMGRGHLVKSDEEESEDGDEGDEGDEGD